MIIMVEDGKWDFRCDVINSTMAFKDQCDLKFCELCFVGLAELDKDYGRCRHDYLSRLKCHNGMGIPLFCEENG